MGKYFGTDGIRGKAERFTEGFVFAVARGIFDYATELGVDNPKVLLGGDTRESTEWILRDFERAFAALGVEYGNVGVLATPGINFAFFEMQFDFAVDVTASHNPYTDNGIKVFERGDKYGVKLSEKGVAAVEKSLAEFEAGNLGELQGSLGGEFVENLHTDAKERYISHLLGFFGAIRPVDGPEEGRNLEGLKIGLDCANGATGVVAADVFRSLGAEVTVINDDTAYGQGINREAGSTHIEGLQRLVVEKGLDFGAAFDGDGDRCLMVSSDGEVVDGDEMLAVLAGWLGLPAVATTVMANQGLFNWADASGVKLAITDVGDQNVFKEMSQSRILLGGEQSGHVILPGEPMGDGVLTALVLSKVVAVTGKTLGELAGVMTKLPQVIENILATEEEKAAFRSGKAEGILAEYERILTEKGGRMLVRPSGTEALIRVTMWGPSLSEIEALAKELGEKIKEVL